MKNMKRILTLGLALALSFSLATPAFAAEDKNNDGYEDTTGEYMGGQTITGNPDTDLKPGTEYTYKNDEGKTVPFIGVIKPTQIKATIPTQVVFDLDPTLDVVTEAGWNGLKAVHGDRNYAQVTNPSNLKILNNSTIPMYVYVSNVMVENAQLVNTNAGQELDTAKNIMFGITSTTKGAVDTIGTAEHWIVPKSATETTVRNPDGTHYMLNKLDTTSPGDGIKTSRYEGVTPADAAGTPGELQLWVNAISITGWNSDDVFTVMPTIIVAAQDPDVTPVYNANVIDPAINPDLPDAIPGAAPTADVVGDVVAGTAVTLTAAADYDIFYTLDGSLPAYTKDAAGLMTAAGTSVKIAAADVATTKVTITGSTDDTVTLKAIAAKHEANDSKVATFTYKIKLQVTAPTIDYTTNISAVTITSTDGGATIYYTLDGTTPTTASTEYTAAFDLSGASDPVTISAFAVEADKIDSAVVTVTYTPGGP